MTTNPHARTPAVIGHRVEHGLFAFYAVVAAIALAGQTGAAVEWLHWWLPTALAAVAAVEFGGIVLSAYGDHRRRLGERAYTARALSAAVATGGVVLNWAGHHDRLQGGFFAGMSALGYLVWLLHSAARRRDQLRAAGKLPDTPPAYGLWQWCRHPGITRRARALALANSATRAAEVSGKPPGTPPSTPLLGLYGSLADAAAAVRTQRRQAAIAAVLRRKIEAGTDALTAEIAVTVFDLDAIAARLAAAADYDGLTALIAADLAPARLTTPSAPHSDTTPVSDGGSGPGSNPPPDRAGARTGTRPGARTRRTPSARATGRTPRPDTTAGRLARLRQQHPDITKAEAARRLDVDVRTVGRNWAAADPDTAGDRRHATDNGGPVSAETVADAHQPADARPRPLHPTQRSTTMAETAHRIADDIDESVA